MVLFYVESIKNPKFKEKNQICAYQGQEVGRGKGGEELKKGIQKYKLLVIKGISIRDVIYSMLTSVYIAV